MSQDLEAPSRTTARIRMGVFVASGALLALMVAVMLLPNTALKLVTGWGGPHTVHDLMFTVFAVTVLVGLAAQIGAPRRRVSAMTLTLGFPLGAAVAGAATDFVFPPLLVMLVLAVIATLSHPGARELLRPQARPSWPSLGLAVVWLVPAMVYAADHLRLQAGAPAGDEHAEVGHWIGAAVIAVLVPVIAAIGGLRPLGWRAPAWTGAAVAVVLGAISVGFPAHPSSFGVGWGAAAIIWGLVLAAVSLVAPTPRSPVTAEARAGGAARRGEVRR